MLDILNAWSRVAGRHLGALCTTVPTHARDGYYQGFKIWRPGTRPINKSSNPLAVHAHLNAYAESSKASPGHDGPALTCYLWHKGGARINEQVAASMPSGACLGASTEYPFCGRDFLVLRWLPIGEIGPDLTFDRDRLIRMALEPVLAIEATAMGQIFDAVGA